MRIAASDVGQGAGPRKIRVNSLDPGMIETEGLRASGMDKGRLPRAAPQHSRAANKRGVRQLALSVVVR